MRHRLGGSKQPATDADPAGIWSLEFLPSPTSRTPRSKCLLCINFVRANKDIGEVSKIQSWNLHEIFDDSLEADCNSTVC